MPPPPISRGRSGPRRRREKARFTAQFARPERPAAQALRAAGGAAVANAHPPGRVVWHVYWIRSGVLAKAGVARRPCAGGGLL
jgi:hypothetical protein